MISEVVQKDEDQGKGAPIPVLISLEPARLELPDTRESAEQIMKNVEIGVGNGLRASLQLGNLVTGSLYISLDYHDGVEPMAVSEFADYPTIPTVYIGFARIQEQINELLDKFNSLPMEETIESVETMVASVTEIVDSLNTVIRDAQVGEVSDEINQTLKELRGVLSGFAPDSPVLQSLEGSLERLHESLYNIDDLTGTLKDQPNSIIFNPKFPEDPIPGAK